MAGRSHPYVDVPTPIEFAHQGGGKEHVENTWPAFRHAVDLGYRFIETDTQVTADGVLIAFHDDTLDRITDRRGRITELPWSEVSRARTTPGGHELVRLDELLERWPDVRFNVDVKTPEALAPTLALVDRLDRHDSVCLAAFSDRTVRGLRRDGRVCTNTGQLATTVLRLGSFLPFRPPVLFGAEVAQVPVRHGRFSVADGRFVRACRRAGLQVHVWTVDDADEMHRLLDLGVDGIMTDRPTVLRDVLVERGEWRGA